MSNQVAPEPSEKGTDSTKGLKGTLNEDIFGKGSMTEGAGGGKIQISPEGWAKFWSLFNLILPAWDFVFACFNARHTFYHLKVDPEQDSQKHDHPHRFCHIGEGTIHDALWVVQIFTLGLYYVISVLFLFAAFSLAFKNPKARMKIVSFYRLSCIILLPVCIPFVHFVLKLSTCVSEVHFWVYYFVALVFLLVPANVGGFIVATKFLRWLKDPARMARGHLASAASNLGQGKEELTGVQMSADMPDLGMTGNAEA